MFLYGSCDALDSSKTLPRGTPTFSTPGEAIPRLFEKNIFGGHRRNLVFYFWNHFNRAQWARAHGPNGQGPMGQGPWANGQGPMGPGPWANGQGPMGPGWTRAQWAWAQWARAQWAWAHGPNGHGPNGHGPMGPMWGVHLSTSLALNVSGVPRSYVG